VTKRGPERPDQRLPQQARPAGSSVPLKPSTQQGKDGVDRTGTDLAAASVRLALEGAEAQTARGSGPPGEMLVGRLNGRVGGGTVAQMAIERLPTPWAEESLEGRGRAGKRAGRRLAFFYQSSTAGEAVSVTFRKNSPCA
jgi:hypothetical protein